MCKPYISRAYILGVERMNCVMILLYIYQRLPVRSRNREFRKIDAVKAWVVREVSNQIACLYHISASCLIDNFGADSRVTASFSGFTEMTVLKCLLLTVRGYMGFLQAFDQRETLP